MRNLYCRAFGVWHLPSVSSLVSSSMTDHDRTSPIKRFFQLKEGIVCFIEHIQYNDESVLKYNMLYLLKQSDYF